MSSAEILEQIRRLPPEKQLEVVEKIRAELGEHDDTLTPEQVAELDRRAERALAHPERCRPLEDVVTDIEKRFRTKR